MANTISDFFPELWLQEALAVYQGATVMPRLVWKNYDMTAQAPGDTVNVQLPGAFVAANKAIGSDYTYQDATATNTAILLNKHKAVPLFIENPEQAKTNLDLIRTYIQPAAVAIAEAVNADLTGLYVDVTQITGAATTFDLPRVTAGTRLLNVAKVPQAPRYLVLGPDAHNNLLDDANLRKFLEKGDQSTLIDGSIGRLYGYDVFLDQQIAEVAGAPGTVHNLAFHPQAFALVTRPLAQIEGGQGGQRTVMVDPVSGVAMSLTLAWDNRRGAHSIVLEMLYGVKTVRPNNAVVVRSIDIV